MQAIRAQAVDARAARYSGGAGRVVLGAGRGDPTGPVSPLLLADRIFCDVHDVSVAWPVPDLLCLSVNKLERAPPAS